MHRWIWQNRRLEQLARLLTPQASAHRRPASGDHRTGPQRRRAGPFAHALRSGHRAGGPRRAHSRDFRDAVPNPRHRLVGRIGRRPSGRRDRAGSRLSRRRGQCLAAASCCPGSESRGTRLPPSNRLPEQVIVAHGEPFSIALHLSATSESRPSQGVVQLGEQQPVSATLNNDTYDFELPAQIDAGRLEVRIGDYRQTVRVEPKLRPELTAVAATFTLPEYLGRPGDQTRDARGGVISLVNGSRVQFTATASRNLTEAQVDGEPAAFAGATVTSPAIVVDGPRRVEFQWKDEFGLAGKEPFSLSVTGQEDEAPSLFVEDLPRQKVVLDSELLNFKIRAHDDFGVKCVGMEWEGVANPIVKAPGEGERLLAAGGNDRESLDVSGTFSAKTLGIEPQPIDRPPLRRRLFPRSRAGLFAPHTALHSDGRAARHLDHRADEQMASPVAGSPRPRNAAVRNEQATPRAVAGRARPARHAPPHRISGRGREGQRTPADEPDGQYRRRPRCGRRCATPRSASAISRNGPRCCRSSKTFPATACPRSPTCSKQASQAQAMADRIKVRRKRRWRAMVRDTRTGSGRQTERG